jgi:uncharacterized protein YndB with AHSA1/START domain
MSSKTIAVEYVFEAPQHKVWRALTDPTLLEKWLMPNDIKPIVGHKFNFHAPPIGDWNGVVECEVLTVEEPTLLRYAWRGGPSQSRLDSIVTWRLSATATGTKLSLEQAGFQPHNAMAFEMMSKGWSGKIAEQLQEVVAQS